MGKEPFMSSLTTEDRARGALLGAFIGDALGLGAHWYYDLDELRRDHGEWIDGYRDPLPGRYHAGFKAGDLSQAGFILMLTLQSLVERGGYDEADFCHRIDRELFPLLDGSPVCGPGGYTSQSIRDAWQKRVVEKRHWGDCGGQADTTEAVERTIAIAVRYAATPALLARAVGSNTVLTQVDEAVVAMTVAFDCVLGLLIQGHPLDEQISGRLMSLVREGALPFHAVTRKGFDPPRRGEAEPPRAGCFASPDALLTPSCVARAAADPGIRICPEWKVSLVYGMPCAIYHQLPAVYYLAARFRNDFESAVLHAINGGGQNMARAMLTGALVGAQVGATGISDRLVAGLRDAGKILPLCEKLAAITASS